MNPSFKIHRRCLLCLWGLILLCALSFCLSAAKFCVSERGGDSAKIARFSVRTNLAEKRLTLRGQKEGEVSFTVSNGEEAPSEVRIEYALSIALPKRAARKIELKLLSESGEQLQPVKKTEGDNTLYTFPRAGIFEAGEIREHKYTLRLNAKRGVKKLDFSLNLRVFARQIFSGD